MTNEDQELLDQLIGENEELHRIINGLLKYVRHDGTMGRECPYDPGDADWDYIPCRCGLDNFVQGYKELL